ncbi:MAG TPA: long-chain fatty acid--CoA ligase, partial [Nannocystis exedens]|nr:long-chain fatty acid--CoA ligase [Nannocystis exedens]
MLDLSRVRCLGDALRDASTTFKSKLALIEADRHRENCRYTFAEARRLAEGFAALIQGRGFAAGDRCAILMQNQSKWLLSATGALWAGAVLVPLDYKLTAREQLDLLAHCRPRVLVTEASTWERLRTENRDRPEILERTLVIVTDPHEGQDLGPALPWQTGAAADFKYTARDRDD